MGKYLLGIDEGTTGCRACIFDFEGNMIGSDYREYPCYYPKPGWVEQTDKDIITGLFESVRAAIAKAQINSTEIVALGISSQGGVFGPVDKNGNLLRPFIGWQDLRGTSYIQKIFERISPEEYYKISGYPLGAIFCITKMLWFKDNEPELYDKTVKLSQHQDFFVRAFGGEGYWADISTASRTGLFDVDNHKWSERILNVVDIPRDKLPDIIERPGQVVGKVTKKVAELTGLAEGTLVCIAAHDQNCSTLGAGLVDPGTAVLVLGTWGSCYVCVDKPIRDPNGVLIVKGNEGPRNWTIEGAASAAASSYRWFRDTFGQLEITAGKILGEDPYDLINKQIASVPPGANGVIFLPYLQGASAGPRANPAARGCLLNLTLSTTKAEIARAVMEGITLEMRDIIEAQRKAGVVTEYIRLTGGGTKSPLWNQMQADIYKTPVQVLQTSETGALGAALFAGIGAGIYKDSKEAVETAVRITDTYEPNPSMFSIYDEAYDRFVKAYQALHTGGFF
jgi:xylulokinase